MGVFSWLKQLDSARRKQRYAEQTQAFQQAVAALGATDIAVDCGANVGIYTEMMAKSGAQVYAFEPNPVAFAALQQRVQSYPNVTLIQAATATKAGRCKLYQHRHAKRDPLLYSVSSSLLAEKSNVNATDYDEVECVSLSQFLQELLHTKQQPIALLKMDIEGAEVAVLNDLLDQQLHQQIVQGFVEVHDRRVPALRAPTAELRARLTQVGAQHITLDWR